MQGAPSGGEPSPCVRLRVCDLRILSRPHYTSQLGSFDVDGLYMVLRLDNDVHRTSCLWQDTSAGDYGFSMDHTADSSDSEDELAETYVWDELFYFSLYDNEHQQQHGRAAMPFSNGSHSMGGAAPSGATLLSQSSGGGTPVPLSVPSTPERSIAYPTITMELWRSTKLSENCLGRYAYCVPFEALVSNSNSGHHHNHNHNHSQHQPSGEDDGIRDKVISMNIAINGSAEPVRVGIRIRLKTEGLPSPTAGYGMMMQSAPPMMSLGQGVLAQPSSTMMGGVDPQLLAALLQSSGGGGNNHYNNNSRHMPVFSGMHMPPSSSGVLPSGSGSILDEPPVLPQYAP